MRPNFKKNPDLEIEQDEDDVVDVESTGPSIASIKKSKVAIIAASSVLIAVVMYFLVFKETPKPEEKLEPVDTPKFVTAGSDTGKSAFELEAPEKSKSEVEILNKPAVPEVPELPELPKDAAGLLQDQLLPAEPAKPEVPALPTIPTPQLPVVQPAQPTPIVPVEQQPVVTNPIAPVEQPKGPDPRYAPIVVFSGPSGGSPALGVGYEKNIINLQQNPIDALQNTAVSVTPTYIKDRAHTIAQGKLFNAILETAINTEIPGSVRAIISRDVYGESGNHVLIPRGSRLFGAYATKISRGQGRVEITWSRLIRSDGVDLAIDFNASDQFGRSGIPGELDNKYGSIIATSLLTSVLALGGVIAAEKMAGNSATTTTTNPSQGSVTTTAKASNQAIYDVSKTIVDTVGQVVSNAINTSPVIRIPQGTRITVVVNSDINIPELENR